MSRIADVYAQGLYSLAAEEGLTDRLLEELTVLEESFAQTPEFIRLLAMPNLSKQERCGILDESFRDKVHIYVLNFLKILTEKSYIRHFDACVRSYEAQYNAQHNILPVQAVSAVAMTAQQQEKLTHKLEAMTGKTVRLQNRVDPQVLGGVRLDYSGVRIDGTVRNRLDQLSKLLENTVI